jgi:hypothetical protein
MIVTAKIRKSEMPETSHPTKVVFFTQGHAVTGMVHIHDLRLSDFLNDRREKNILLRDATVARLQNPAIILQRTQVSIIPKSGIILAFEPSKNIIPPTRRFMKYHKEKYEVFIIMYGMEVRGETHVQGSFDLLKIMADSGESFLPITQASVSIEANSNLLIQREAVMINIQRIRFIGEIQPKIVAESHPSAPHPGD